MATTRSDIEKAVLYGDPVELCTNFVRSRGGLARLPIPNRDIWIVSNPVYVERILASRESDKFGKGGDILAAVAADLGTTGLFNVDDFQQWRMLRTLINPEFHVSQAAMAVGVVNAIWDQQMAGWQTTQPIRLHDEFVRLNLQYLMQNMFGQSVSPENIALLARLAQPVFADMFKRIALSLLAPPLAKKLTRARNALDQAVQKIIARSESGHDDLLKRFKAAQEQNPMITDQVIRDQVFTLLMAGFDSTATVTSWAAIELVKRPEWFRAVRREVLEKVGAKRSPQYDDVQNLATLHEFLRHVLRAHPAFPLFFRDVRVACMFGEQRIEKGATLVINLDALHRSLPAKNALPFGAGQRKCPAERLAMVSMAVPLVKMMQRYATWQNVGNPDAARYTMTRWPKDQAAMMLA